MGSLRCGVQEERPDGAARSGGDLRHEQSAVAKWVVAFAAPAYGPWGGRKLVDGDPPTFLRSGASALREVGLSHAAVRGYRDLAATVQGQAGDQATAALLLMARLVEAAAEGTRSGVGAAAWLDGFAAAKRQALAVLASLRTPQPMEAVLASVVPAWQADLAGVAASLQQRAASPAGLDLEAVDVVAQDVPGVRWLDGVVATPRHEPAGDVPEGPILLLSQGWKVGPWREGLQYRMGEHTAVEFLDEEERIRRTAHAHLRKLGVRGIACTDEVEHALATRLRGEGVVVWNDVPRDALRRLERLTGGKPVARLLHATPADLGRASWSRRSRRERGWLVRGPGPAATLVVPAVTANQSREAKDDAERLLRTAGALLAQNGPVAVPGGGRWQREVARALRRAADAADGKAPIAMRGAAAAFDGLADDLVRNRGLDPMDHALPQDAAAVWDAYPCVRVAVSAAFEAAMGAVRTDARHEKAGSVGDDLRGGGSPKSLREMAGDVPEHM